MLIDLIVVIISQCILSPNHHVAHFKYITDLFINYTSVKLEKEKNKI